MLGAITGDIVGSCYEFNPTNDYGFDMFPPGSGFTDDTICTVAVADAILHGRDYGESIHDWCRRYPHPKGGYGGRFHQWVMSDYPKPYGSFGNGSAMRVSPAAWAGYDEKSMLEEAALTASCSHNHVEGIKGAQTVALAIFLAGKHRPVEEILDRCARFSGYDLNIRQENVVNRFDETCQGTVPVALWIIEKSNSFEDAIRRSVSLGADADTLGAIVGSIAQPIWGIPDSIREKVMSMLPAEMKNIIKEFENNVIHHGN